MLDLCDTSPMGNDHWPLFDLEIGTPRLTLAVPRRRNWRAGYSTLPRTAVHDPASMPFSIPWTDLPSPEMEQEAMRFYARTCADVRPLAWNLQFAVIVDGSVIGSVRRWGLRLRGAAPVHHRIVARTRVPWAGATARRCGLAALTLGFDGLGAEFARTGVVARQRGVARGHPIARATSRSGTPDSSDAAYPTSSSEFRMPRAHWETIRRDDIAMAGIDATRGFLDL